MSDKQFQILTAAERMPDLDGYRGLAILMVIACHSIFAPRLGEVSPGSIVAFGFSFFASGVDLFFVLSGFLIGGILLDNRGAPRYFSAFYGRRILRIFPVYYGFLLVILGQGLIFHAYHKATPVFDAGTPFLFFLVYLQNFGMAWFNDWNWITVTMTWSLALEEQFYLTLPVAVKALRKSSLVAISGIIVMLAPVARCFLPNVPHGFGTLVLMAFRADALAAGFLCAIFVRSNLRVSNLRIVVLTAVSVLFIALSYIANSPAPFLRPTLLITLYSSGLLLAVQGQIAPLRWPLMRFFGTISYTLYMIHQSALVTLRSVFRHFLPEFHGQSAVVSSVAFLLSIAICKASWDYFEQPTVSWARRRFRYQKNS
jgi:peptidoglycan/LPS O-acetylase OafA/YrhL